MCCLAYCTVDENKQQGEMWRDNFWVLSRDGVEEIKTKLATLTSTYVRILMHTVCQFVSSIVIGK